MSVLACLHVCLHVHVCVCTTGCADLMTLDTMSPQERKRQGYIHELIQTEEIYVEDLELVLEVQAGRHIKNNEWAFSEVLSADIFFSACACLCMHRCSTSPCLSLVV